MSSCALPCLANLQLQLKSCPGSQVRETFITRSFLFHPTVPTTLCGRIRPVLNLNPGWVPWMVTDGQGCNSRLLREGAAGPRRWPRWRGPSGRAPPAPARQALRAYPSSVPILACDLGIHFPPSRGAARGDNADGKEAEGLDKQVAGLFGGVVSAGPSLTTSTRSLQ
jgi:hypothetical protein